MLCYQVTGWNTFRSSNTFTVFTQPAHRYLDLTRFQDINAWLEVKEVSFTGGTGPTIKYQTAPTKDDELFINLTTAVTLAVGLTTTKMLKATVTNPLSRWFRWQLGSGGATDTWDVTFRLWIAANLMRQGGRIPLAAETKNKMLHGMPTPSLAASSIGKGSKGYFTGQQKQSGGMMAAPGYTGPMMAGQLASGPASLDPLWKFFPTQ